MDNLSLFDELLLVIEEAKENAEKFYLKGNKSAGVKLRKSMQEVKKLAQGVRLEVSEAKKK